MIELLKKVFGTKHTRDVKRLRPLVARINAIEEEYQRLSEAQIKAKTQEFRERFAKGETLDDLLPEAYAAVKNACRRLWGTTRDVCGHAIVWEMIPFDVQLLGGIVLHQGKISEMQTGEGKTLVATLPLYLNALAGKNVHLVTVNDYLARRDSQWMGAIYEYLGLTVGCIQNHQSPAERRLQYGCDITYGTNSEFGFDYLRDNGMASSAEHQVQRGYHFAIIDEVDSILIDEARTPLIISGPAAHSSNQYGDLKPKVERLVKRQQSLMNDMVAHIRKLIDTNKAMEPFYFNIKKPLFLEVKGEWFVVFVTNDDACVLITTSNISTSPYLCANINPKYGYGTGLLSEEKHGKSWFQHHDGNTVVFSNDVISVTVSRKGSP